MREEREGEGEGGERLLNLLIKLFHHNICICSFVFSLSLSLSFSLSLSLSLSFFLSFFILSIMRV